MAPETGVAVLDWFFSFLDSWGYLIVFLFTVFENLFVIGSFTPGELMVMAAGFVTVKGGLDPALVAASSMAGTLVGTNLSYYFGRRGGRQALKRWGGRFFDEDRIRASEEYFERHGSPTVLFARFAAVFKNFVPVIAGVAKMRIWVFELYTVIGALIYTTLMLMLGRIFAENFDRAIAIARNLTWLGTILLVVALAFLLWGRRKVQARRIGALSEAADEPDEPPLEEPADA
jgi:membrane-associated protein